VPEFISSNPVTVIIFVCALVWMLGLAKKDHSSLKADQHVDMKSVIVSIGVLGTFIGIAIGLWEFDTNNIDDSVPALLEGLKLAFATSIVGMFISIVLSSIQKDKLVGGNDELSVLAQINDKLSGLAEMNEQVKGLRLEIRDEQRETRSLLDKANNSLGKVASEKSIQSFRNDVNDSQVKTKNFLETQFLETNKSLKEAIEVLSHGATEEIIKALDKVITDFNENLTSHFGDNFDQLNKAVVALLKWQEQFKDIVEKDYGLLIEIRGSMESSSNTLETVASRNQETLKVYEQLKDLINVYDNQVQILNKQLDEFSTLSEKASKSFDVLNGSFERVEAGMGSQSETISKLTQDLSKKLPESLGKLEDTLVGLTDQFGKDYKDFLENYRKLIP